MYTYYSEWAVDEEYRELVEDGYLERCGNGYRRRTYLCG